MSRNISQGRKNLESQSTDGGAQHEFCFLSSSLPHFVSISRMFLSWRLAFVHDLRLFCEQLISALLQIHGHLTDEQVTRRLVCEPRRMTSDIMEMTRSA
jgi:hypothetical protein